MDIDLVAKKAIKYFGAEEQLLKAIEEMGELISIIAKAPKNRPINKKVIDEIADVQIMVRQLRLIYGAEQVDRRIEFKLDRLLERMK